MSDILERLAGLGVTKGFPSGGSRTVRKTADAVAMLKTKFPDAIVSENRYGEVFNVRSHFPLSGRIGTAPLSAPFRRSPRLDAVLTNDRDIGKYGFVAMDTETSGLSFDSAGFVFMIGLSYFVPDGLVVDQFILPDLSGERAFLEAVRATVERFDAFVTYNGKSFDVPMIHAREKVHFLPHAFDGLAHFDLLYPVRRFWKKRLHGCRLRNVEEEILGFVRGEEEIPGDMAPDLYRDFLRDGDLTLMGGVSYHNRMDVASLSAFMLLMSEMCASEAGDDELESRYRLDSFAYRSAMALADLASVGKDFILSPGRYSDAELKRIAAGLKRAGRIDDALEIYLRIGRAGNVEGLEKAAALLAKEKRDYPAALTLYTELIADIRSDSVAGEWSKAQKLDKIQKKVLTIERKIRAGK